MGWEKLLLRVYHNDVPLFTVWQVSPEIMRVDLPYIAEISAREVERKLSLFAYGFKVRKENRSLFVVALEKCGLTPRGKALLHSLGLKTNPVWWIPVAIIVAIIVLCSIPGIRENFIICRGLEEMWEVIKPWIIYSAIAITVIAVGAAAYAAVKMAR